MSPKPTTYARSCVLLTEEYRVLQGGGNSPYQKDKRAPKEQQRLSWQHHYQHFRPARRDPFDVARRAMHSNRHRSSACSGNLHGHLQSAGFGIRGQPDELDIITDGYQYNAPMKLHVHRKSAPFKHHPCTSCAKDSSQQGRAYKQQLASAVWGSMAAVRVCFWLPEQPVRRRIGLPKQRPAWGVWDHVPIVRRRISEQRM